MRANIRLAITEVYSVLPSVCITESLPETLLLTPLGALSGPPYLSMVPLYFAPYRLCFCETLFVVCFWCYFAVTAALYCL